MTQADQYELYMLGLINAERAQVGADPLALELSLNTASELHSLWMLQHDVFSHTGIDGSSATQRMRDAGFDFSGAWRSAENIAVQSERGAAGIMDDVRDLHVSLMNSPGHRANLLNPALDYIGIGIELGDFNFSSGTYQSVIVTQTFAATGGAVALDIGAARDPDPVPAPDPVPVPRTPVEDADFDGTGGDDTLAGGDGHDTLSGNAGNDSLRGGMGDDLLNGGFGFDVMHGDAGHDTLIGLQGYDTLDGGAGDDSLRGNAGNDSLRGGTGADRLEGGIGFDTLHGEDGDDVILAGNGFDLLFGGAGDDRLEGNAGNDRLDGGAGADVLIGGIGADAFVFGMGYGADRIADFQNGIDSIEIEATLLGGGMPEAADLIQYAGRDGDGFLILDFGGGDTLTFTGVTNTGTILDEVSFI